MKNNPMTAQEILAEMKPLGRDGYRIRKAEKRGTIGKNRKTVKC